MTQRITLSNLLFAACLAWAGSDSPLADAASKMDRATVRALIAKRVDVNAAQIDGSTALHWAAYQDDLETSQLLVNAGANVKTANRYGVTPLSMACTNGNTAMVELLLAAGADPNTFLPGGETALMTAARTGKAGPVNALIAKGAGVHAKESRLGQTAIMWAAAEGHAEAVRILIKAGADFRASLDSGFTPLLFAVREGRTEVVRVLLSAGADVNATMQPRKVPRLGPKAGTSPLSLAVENGHFELAIALVDAGANPNAGLTGYTVLHSISWVRKSNRGDEGDPSPQGSGNLTSIEFVKKLVARGANLNAAVTKEIRGLTRLGTLGATPFLLAARSADVELMRTLVALGADPLRPNAENSTPLMAAAGLGTVSPGEDPGTETEALEALQMTLDLGGDINAVDNKGETAMHGAAYKHFPAVVQWLTEKGAKIEIWNRKNKHGWTPLAIASGYRFGNYKPSQDTMDAFSRVMTAAGVPAVFETKAGAPVYVQ
ncbi:MAG: ankyrin repeat domain-containing protein [Acidobacteriia bacterium]|nr:ankyrin repeat domain-containing protein [Terriglobia bacterium]